MLELMFFLVFALLFLFVGLAIFGFGTRRKSDKTAGFSSKEFSYADACRKAENKIGSVVDAGLGVTGRAAESLGMTETAQDLKEESSYRKDATIHEKHH